MPDRPDHDLPTRRDARTESDETRRDWEGIQDNGDDDVTERLRIVGGWLYRTRAAEGVALVFVPTQAGE